MILDTFACAGPKKGPPGDVSGDLRSDLGTGLRTYLEGFRRSSSRLAVVGLTLVGVIPAAVAQPVSKTQFLERAAEVGLNFSHYSGMTGKLYFPEMTGGSVALLDYDNDGDLDVYFGQGTLYFEDKKETSVLPSRYPHPVVDRLYRNDFIPAGSKKGALRFTDVTEEAGLKPYGNNMGVSAGDYNNDGYVDLYLTNVGDNVLLANQGDGTFKDVTEKSKTGDDTWSVAATFIDYDRDGWLDLFVGNYVEFREATVKNCTGGTGALDYCGPQSYPPLENRLFRNKGDGTFEDVTIKALAESIAGPSLGVVSADFNGDGWIDIYVANDLKPNDLWLNQKDGTFVNDAMFSGAAVDVQGLAQASMGVVAGDLNGDGAEDLFMAHLAMEMNTLYINDGSGLFHDGSSDSGLGMASWKYTGFGTGLGDFNNDGLVDLYIGNGAVKRIEEQMRDDEKHPLRESNLLFRSSAPGKFALVPDAERVDTVYSEVTRGVAVGDLDNDGRLDLVVANNAGTARFLHNNSAFGGDSSEAWLGIAVRLPPSLVDKGAGKQASRQFSKQGRYALGAQVSLHWKDAEESKAGGGVVRTVQIVRRARRDGSFASAGDPRVHFGIGQRAAPDWVEVFWPDGKRERFVGVLAGRYTELIAGQGKAIPSASKAGTSGK